ncbi:MAG: hypothetical protein IJP27_06725 [Clostridia bacterium]|nr:hypothetical protein [Clostridia bacterium]
MNRNIPEARQALTQKPLFATSAERFLILDELKSTEKELPQPLRFSRILRRLLERVSVPLEEHDLLAGRCVDRELTPEEEAQFQAYLTHPDHPAKGLFWSSGHCTYSWELLVKEGLPGLQAMAEARLSATTDPEKRFFLTAISETYAALRNYLLRYAEAAAEKGMEQTARNLTEAATARPTTFGGALQLLWTVTLVNCAYISPNPTLTVGRLDQILYPLYQDGLKKGTLTPAQAKRYITDYYCKHNLIMGRGEHQVGDASNSTTFQRILNFDAPQYLLLAGTDAQGNPAANELTELFAECIDPAFKNPVVVVRYVRGMDTANSHLWQTLCDRALSGASLMFYNDENVLAAFRRLGLPDADARRYAHFGCNWCSPGDHGAWMQSHPKSWEFNGTPDPKIPYMRTNSPHSWPEDFMIVLQELAEREDATIEDFYTRFFARMAAFIDRKLAYLSAELAERKRHPAAAITFGDCFLADSLQKAECFAAGAKYHFELQAFQMFGTVADCFIAVDQLVMRQKKLTLRRLLQAVEADFEGYSDVLALCRNADKFGMNTPLSIEHTQRLSATASQLVIEKNRPYFETQRLFLVPCMQSDTWHLKYGEGFGATPDGRRAGTPFSQNSRPSNGSARNGLTAMFNDLLLLPRDGLVSGALNLDIDPRPFKSNGLFPALLAAYFNEGGLHAQVTATDEETLQDARKNPHLHRDLRVRVTGYSGIFVDLPDALQEDVINRMKGIKQ